MRIVIDAFAGSGNADFVKEFQRARLGFAGTNPQMGRDCFSNLFAHGVKRIQAGQRILKDRADAAAANFANFLIREIVNTTPSKPYLTAGDPARRLQKADHGIARH